ncbi:MAG: [protein-PII] uridylyltransferase [Gammaproteobacteria bacterium]|nr:[protein-PII] uridylyltransferase [Gammaproteobacteria bacterium]MBQ0839016.1 [protein-PII] uridylyltransferase [Gammaproteobacteria bacterium]
MNPASIALPIPLFFDEKRFLASLDKGDAQTVFKDAIRAADTFLNNQFEQGEDAETLVHERAAFIDRILLHAWQRFSWDKNISLLAVGGYGRGELHPHSDIDLLILSKHKNHNPYKTNIEGFLTFLWDIQLNIGHSVRSLSHCVEEAKADITVATNIMESRTLAGNGELQQKMEELTGPAKIWPAEQFFRAKYDEQNERHDKHGNTEYNLEPNIKEAPGGLRDIQTISWVAKRHFHKHSLAELANTHFLAGEEYELLRKGQAFLWRVRYGLHLIAGRPEERLLFDSQRKLAQMFGYKDTRERLAVEQFMQRYYRVVLAMREQNDMLLHYMDEVINKSRTKNTIRPINSYFQVRDHYIEVIDDTVFARYPSALLEIFVLLGEDSSIQGVRSTTIRQIRQYRHQIDDNFRNDPVNRQLFMRLFRCKGNLTTQLQRMIRYGILGKYLPEFDRIIGLMQHDLFHIYPVDAHTIQLIRNIRRLGNAKEEEKFPVASHVLKNLPKPELLLIAGLYHDIAKGRGGDHSKLGAVDAADFTRRHGFSEQESQLICWLVESHLLMSSVSQREDISDPDVIHKFALLVGDQMHLDHLFTLTIADINATNPTLWNNWKGSLMRQLYFQTREALKRGLESPVSKKKWIDNTRNETLALLEKEGISQQQSTALWTDMDSELFLRESASVIARGVKAVLSADDPSLPVILIEDAGMEDDCVTRIFIHTKNMTNVFPIIAATLDTLRLNIHDARLYTGNKNHTYDIFYVLDDQGQPFATHSKKARKVARKLSKALQADNKDDIEVNRRTPRQLKQLTIGTSAHFDHSHDCRATYLEVITPDRPGLLAELGQIIMRFKLNLHSAKIATLGERVEDVFYLTDAQNQPLTDLDLCQQIEQTICRELDTRNLEDEDAGNTVELLQTRH